MMNQDDDIKNALNKSEKDFARSTTVMKSKEKLFNSIMGEIAPHHTITFKESEELVESMASRRTAPSVVAAIPKAIPFGTIARNTTKKRKASKFPAALGALTAMAALFTIVVINTQKPAIVNVNPTTFSPPLTQEDAPRAITQPNSSYRTIATNNDFYLGYLEADSSAEVVEIIVHSRSAEIDWTTLYAVDGDNDFVAPISVDQEKGIVYLPATETDISLEIKDADGELIKCIIPANL